ncbi:hypothetical protein [Kitasatospora sp. NPDC015120]|uniref:hypothetical protein n=1 Tax=Kitasatospora sp. NPDC015120 TaxID=3364023 RepID=UPI0036F462D3
MSAARTPLPGPDMGGLQDDWNRLANARKKAETTTPAPAEPQASEPAAGDHDAVTPRPHDATPETTSASAPTARSRRSRGGRRPAPAAADAVALTVRVDPDEATEIDLWLLGLRDDARRTRLDKSEALRELLRLAREDDRTRRALLKRLT